MTDAGEGRTTAGGTGKLQSYRNLLGQASAESFQIIGNNLKREGDPAVRAAILQLIGTAKSPHAAQVQLKFALDADASVRLASLRGLIQSGNPAVYPVFVRLLLDSSPEVRSCAQQSVLALGKENFVKLLQTMVESAHSWQVEAAVIAACRLKSQSVVPVLETGHRTGGELAKDHAIKGLTALVQLDTPGAQDALDRLTGNAPSPSAPPAPPAAPILPEVPREEPPASTLPPPVAPTAQVFDAPARRASAFGGPPSKSEPAPHEIHLNEVAEPKLGQDAIPEKEPPRKRNTVRNKPAPRTTRKEPVKNLCPACAEIIPPGAEVCEFCGEILSLASGWDRAAKLDSPIDQPLAPWHLRCSTALLDTALFFVPTVLFTLLAIVGAILRSVFGFVLICIGVLGASLCLIVAPFYLSLKDWFGQGQSYGKRAGSLFVIDRTTGKPCSLLQTILRNLTQGIPVVGLVDLILLVATGVRLGDRIAGTRVVRPRSAGPVPRWSIPVLVGGPLMVLGVTGLGGLAAVMVPQYLANQLIVNMKVGDAVAAQRGKRGHVSTAGSAAGLDQNSPGGTVGSLDPNHLLKIRPKARFKLPGGHSRVTERTVHVSNDGQRLAVNCEPFSTLVWQLSPQPKILAEFKGGCSALSPSGKRVLAYSSYTSCSVFDVDTKKELAQLPDSFTDAFFRDDNTVVATKRSFNVARPGPGKITILDVDKNAEAGSIVVPDNRYDNAFPVKNGKEFWLFMIADNAAAFRVNCYDLEAKTLVRTLKLEPKGGQEPLKGRPTWKAAAPDGSAFTLSFQRMAFYSGDTGKEVAPSLPDTYGMSDGFIPGGSRFLSWTGTPLRNAGFGPAEMILYDWKTQKALAVVTGHSAGQTNPQVGTSANGKTLVSISKEGEGLVFDMGSQTAAGAPESSPPEVPQQRPVQPSIETSAPSSAADASPSPVESPPAKTSLAPGKPPVPDRVQQGQALKLIREQFKDDFAKSDPDYRATLAGKLLKQAQEPQTDPISRFVLLTQVRDLAVAAGDLDFALQMVDEQANGYAVDALADKLEILRTRAATITDPKKAELFIAATLVVFHEAMANGNFDIAEKILLVAEPLGRKSGVGPSWATTLKDLKASIASARTDAAQSKVAFNTLKVNPEDPAANVVLGRFRCFRLGKWILGVPRLAKGNDLALKELAALDTAAKDAETQVKAAAAWWDYSEKEPEKAAKQAARERAAYWYTTALPELTGPAQQTAQTRIEAQAAESEKQSRWTVLFRSDNAQYWNTKGWGFDYALPLDQAPEAMQFLRLRRMDTGEAMILPLARQELWAFDTRNCLMKNYKWNGNSSVRYGGGYRLGIAQGGAITEDKAPDGFVLVAAPGRRLFTGSGFGTRVSADNTQHYCWQGTEIGRTAFEIAVSPGPLSGAEQHVLLKNPKVGASDSAAQPEMIQPPAQLSGRHVRRHRYSYGSRGAYTSRRGYRSRSGNRAPVVDATDSAGTGSAGDGVGSANAANGAGTADAADGAGTTNAGDGAGTTAAAPVSVDPDVKITAFEIWEDFWKHHEPAREKYMGKTVEVEGEVLEPVKRFMNEYRFYLRGSAPPNSGVITYDIHGDEPLFAAAKKLKVGQSVKITAHFRDGNLYGPFFNKVSKIDPQ